MTLDPELDARLSITAEIKDGRAFLWMTTEQDGLIKSKPFADVTAAVLLMTGTRFMIWRGAQRASWP